MDSPEFGLPTFVACPTSAASMRLIDTFSPLNLGPIARAQEETVGDNN